jgi:hypothetical protein
MKRRCLVAMVLLAVVTIGSIVYILTDFNVPTSSPTQPVKAGETASFVISVSFVGLPQDMDIGFGPPRRGGGPGSAPSPGLGKLGGYIEGWSISKPRAETNWTSTVQLRLSQQTPSGVYELTIYVFPSFLYAVFGVARIKTVTAILIVR